MLKKQHHVRKLLRKQLQDVDKDVDYKTHEGDHASDLPFFLRNPLQSSKIFYTLKVGSLQFYFIQGETMKKLLVLISALTLSMSALALNSKDESEHRRMEAEIAAMRKQVERLHVKIDKMVCDAARFKSEAHGREVTSRRATEAATAASAA